jgi:hypothetical protein
MHNKGLEQESKPRYMLGFKHILTYPEENSKFYSAQMAESNIPALPKICVD